MTRDPEDPRAGLERLFGEDAAEEAPPVFGGENASADPASRLRSAAVRIRTLRSQVHAEGLTPAATRSLLDEIVRALEAAAEGVRWGATNPPSPRDR